MKKSWVLGLIAMLLLASCGSSAPLHQYTKGDVLASNDFSSAASFEEGAYSAATLQIIDGAYQIDVLQGDNVLWWGQWGDTYKDVVIDVDAEQQSETTDNAYGVMCRVQGTVGQQQPVDATLAATMHDSTPEATANASAEAASTAVVTSTAEATPPATAPVAPITATALLTATPKPVVIPISNGDGYLFLLQGSGEFAIMRSRGRNLTPLVDWKTSSAIKQGAAQNHIRAICAGNYLALYINDQFMGDATDDTYASGQVGLGASSADRAGTRIAFDNLTISTPVQK